MGAVQQIPAGSEPAEWFVAFHRECDSKIISFLAFGEFKHVLAFGYCPGLKVWIVFDVTWQKTWVRLLSHEQGALEQIAEITRNCAVVKIAPQGRTPRLITRIGYFCVPAIISLLGLKCVAITPTSLYRYLRKNGGYEINAHVSPSAAAAPNRSQSGGRATAGASGLDPAIAGPGTAGYGEHHGALRHIAWAVRRKCGLAAWR
jgi:hypothetical protein